MSDLNPPFAHRVALDVYLASVKVVPLGPSHGRKWEVFRGGVSEGFSDASDPGSAAVEAHARSVNNALFVCSTDGLPDWMVSGSVLPSPAALQPHLSTFAGMGLERAIEQALAEGSGWTASLSRVASAEGWDIFEVVGEGPMIVQCDSDVGLLDNDDRAASLVWSGVKLHHFAARTLLYELAPAEYARIRNVVLADESIKKSQMERERVS